MFAAEFLINKMAREYNETFMGVVTSLKEEIEFQDLIQSIEEKNIYKISAATKFEKFQQKLSQFKPLILSTISIAARETEKKKNILLDLDREVNLNEVNKVTNKFITGMAEQQKLVVQKIIYDGIDRQLSAKSIADKLINNIGLNAPQTEILQNLENNLINSNTNKTTINKIIEQKSKQFLKTRAETIALTESANAISSGRYLMQQQMYEDGDISRDTMQEWYTASSEITCSVCAPMHGQRIKMNELFTTGSGSKVKSPILHARCRCIVVINF
jgi:hypothetical protein